MTRIAGAATDLGFTTSEEQATSDTVTENHVIATRPENPRAASPEEIQQAGSRTGIEIETVAEVGEALERARAIAGPQAVLVVTGSIYLVGEAMRLLDVRA